MALATPPVAVPLHVLAVQKVAPVKLPPLLSHAAEAFAGGPANPLSQVNSLAAASVAAVHPDSPSSQLVPSLSVPEGSVHLNVHTRLPLPADAL